MRKIKKKTHNDVPDYTASHPCRQPSSRSLATQIRSQHTNIWASICMTTWRASNKTVLDNSIPTNFRQWEWDSLNAVWDHQRLRCLLLNGYRKRLFLRHNSRSTRLPTHLDLLLRSIPPQPLSFTIIILFGVYPAKPQFWWTVVQWTK
jgi:hypothetical protein